MRNEIIYAIISGLVTSFVGFIIKTIVRKSNITRRWKIIFVIFLLLILISSGYIFFLFIWHYLPPDIAFPKSGWIIIIVTASVQILSIIGLYYLIKDLQSGIFSSPFVIKFDKPGQKYRMAKIRSIIHGKTKADERLYLDWKTFGEGIIFLRDQVKDYAPAVVPDVCIGINNAGLIIASFLAGSLGVGRGMVGFAKTEGDNHRVREFNFPDNSTPKIDHILIADVSVKSGDSLKNVCAVLKEKYGTSVEIKIACLAACQVAGKITAITDLLANNAGHKGIFNQDPVYLPDFLAFISGPRLRLPGDIR